MSDRTTARREALRSRLLTERSAAVLISNVTNVSYLTGFSGDSSTLLLTPDRALIVSDGRYTEQLRRECPEVEAVIRPVGQTMATAIAGVAAGLGLGDLAFEAATLTVAERDAIAEAAPTVALRGVQGWVEALRMVKDDGELAAIREAIGMAERAFARLRPEIAPGRTEKEMADDLEHHLRRCGASGAAFPPIIAAGRNAALPHARPSASARLGESDLLLVDWGAAGRPYKSDLTRMIVTGKVCDTFESVYRAVLAAQARAIALIRPGVTSRVLDAEARAVLEAAGYGPHFTHGLGHGLGMDIHEAPFLGRMPDLELRPGMVVTIEPGVYLPDWGGVRIEDDVLVTPDGAEVLTGVPKDLDSVRLGP